MIWSFSLTQEQCCVRIVNTNNTKKCRQDCVMCMSHVSTSLSQAAYDIFCRECYRPCSAYALAHCRQRVSFGCQHSWVPTTQRDQARAQVCLPALVCHIRKINWIVQESDAKYSQGAHRPAHVIWWIGSHIFPPAGSGSLEIPSFGLCPGLCLINSQW